MVHPSLHSISHDLVTYITIYTSFTTLLTRSQLQVKEVLTSSKLPSKHLQYSLRNASDYKYIRSNTQLYSNSFLPSVVRDWNELPHTFRNVPSISAFKRSLNSTLIGVPLFYLDGKRIGQIYYSQVRMDCSSLNHNLLSKIIIDSSLCICSRPETTKHYLFD